ncbi:MAG: putative rane protein [Acidobacteria bacterium]|nr:putative rane protein [Acidobacteriota bacterium]
MALRSPAASSLRAAFVAAAAAWAALIVLAPWLASASHASPLASAVILGVYGIGSAICHQRPERSFHLWTTQMPVCARCAGIYAGAVLGALGALTLGRARGRRTRRASDPRVALAIGLAPTLVTLVYEWTTGAMPSHAIRAAAGLAIGVVVAWLLVAAADNRVN